jgi:hypothetical protein
MSLAWNTRRQIEVVSAPASGERVEYHLRSWRRLRDDAIVSADPDHSSAGEWVVQAGHYVVSVMTRPTYSLPQELCLSFVCYSRKLEATGFMSEGPPIDEVAYDFATLLSLFARHPVGLVGVRRLDDRPIILDPDYDLPRRPAPTKAPPECALRTSVLNGIIDGIAKSEEDAMIEVVFAALRLYYLAISTAHFDPSGAYASLIAALETLAAYHYKDKSFTFADLTKFDGVRPTLEKLRSSPEASQLVDDLERKLAKNESAVARKLRMFVAEFLPEEFWTSPDELRPQDALIAQIPRDELDKRLKAAYGARSSRTHAGAPFPPHVEFGTSDRVPMRVMAGLMDQGADKRVPTFGWFERMTQAVTMEYLSRSFAPGTVALRSRRADEKARLLAVLAGLDPDEKESLEKLTKWTVPLVNFAIINPMARNAEWAKSPAAVQSLESHGLIGTAGDATTGTAWLKNRVVGEAVGEFFYGSVENPLRECEILLPEGFEEDLVATPKAAE